VRSKVQCALSVELMNLTLSTLDYSENEDNISTSDAYIREKKALEALKRKEKERDLGEAKTEKLLSKPKVGGLIK
jgi:hypothetical protein